MKPLIFELQNKKLFCVLFFFFLPFCGCISQQTYLKLKKQNTIQAKIIHQSQEKIQNLERQVEELKQENFQKKFLNHQGEKQ